MTGRHLLGQRSGYGGDHEPSPGTSPQLPIVSVDLPPLPIREETLLVTPSIKNCVVDYY